MNHVTIGVYLNNSYKANIVAPQDLENHIDYNITFRPGRALFVDGKCVNIGYLPEQQVVEWEQKIATMKFNTSKVTLPYQ